MPGFSDVDRAEIDGQDIEGGFGAALHNGHHFSHQGIRAVALDRLDHQPSGPAAAQGLHQTGGQGVDKGQGATVVIDYSKPAQYVSEPTGQLFNNTEQQVHGAAGPKDPDCHQHGDQIRDDGDCNFETISGAVDELFIDIDFFAGGQEKSKAVTDILKVASIIMFRTSGLPRKKIWQMAVTAAERKKPIQIMFNNSLPPSD
jgi:hypothetical protein